MKKIVSIITIFALLLMVGCGKNDESTSANQQNQVTVAEDSETPSDGSENEQEVDNNAPLFAKQDINEDVTVKETVLLDESGVKITLKSILFDDDDPTLSLLLENNTDKNLCFQTRGFSVNGYMADNYFSPEVAAGKKANESMEIESSSLEKYDIETIADVEFSFHIFNSDDGDKYVVDTEPVCIKTSAASTYEYTYDDSGTPIYNGNGITIVFKEMLEDEDDEEVCLRFFVHNESDGNITIQARDLSINGFMVDDTLSDDIASKKYALADIKIDKSELERNDITNITDAEFYFHIFNSDDWNDSIDTDIVSLTF